MSVLSRVALLALGGAVLAIPASAQTVVRKDLSVDGAVIIATTAMADCKAKGWPVSVTIVGRTGETIVQLRGDGTGPHTIENSWKKAFTARTFRIASGEMEKRLKDNPQMGAQYLTGFTTGRGALPIKVGDDVKWSDGVPLEAKHFRDSWQRLLDPATGPSITADAVAVNVASRLPVGAARAALAIRSAGPRAIAPSSRRPARG